MKLVLDSSMALSWFFRDERDATAVSALRYVKENGALVPSLWSIEIAHVLIKSERRGRLTAEQTSAILDYLRALPFTVESGNQSPAFPQIALARQFELSAYDAAYLDLAIRFGLPLATRNDRLAAAAESLGIKWTSTTRTISPASPRRPRAATHSPVSRHRPSNS